MSSVATNHVATHPTTSPLDDPPQQFADQPFYAQTIELLRCVRDHDDASLSELCDDDFGIVDVDPAGVAATRPSQRTFPTSSPSTR